MGKRETRRRWIENSDKSDRRRGKEVYREKETIGIICTTVGSVVSTEIDTRHFQYRFLFHFFFFVVVVILVVAGLFFFVSSSIFLLLIHINWIKIESFTFSLF